MSISFGADPARAEVDRIISMLERGETVDSSVERQIVDLKEEAGRRGAGGVIGPGSPTNEPAAKQLAGESACMANTPGGGALIVGVADDGTVVGADLDHEWLRKRIYDLTERRLTVDVTEVHVRGDRLLVLVVPTAVEPIRWQGKIHWRVGDTCVEVDASTWHAKRMSQLHYDWSAEESTVSVSDARPQAMAVARDFLADAGSPGAADLVGASDLQLLRRLNAVTGQGMLTNAGVLAFVGRHDPALDYVHRDYAGGDSTARVRRSGRSLLEELSEVFVSVDANNVIRHVQTGLAVGQVRDIPRLAAREAIVNGVAHREWGVPEPTVVEHVGRTLRVTSPGGFFGGVNEGNIITHPSQSRNRSLTQLLADLKVAEREGIGVDRMVREMVRVGHRPPDIREITGPFVRASLVGETWDEAWIAWLGAIEPKAETQDINSLLLLRRLVDDGWVDEVRAAPLIQLTIEEARGALLKLAGARLSGAAVLARVEGVPDGTAAAWQLAPRAWEELGTADRAYGNVRTLPSRTEIARSYAAARGRISTTELGCLVRASGTNVGGTLKGLEQEGVLAPSSAARRGRGFFYRWVGDAAPDPSTVA
jgi:ATP-dependent DNA helicase RecG